VFERPEGGRGWRAPTGVERGGVEEGLIVFWGRPSGDGLVCDVAGVETERDGRIGKDLRYGEGVVRERGLKLCPISVSLRFVDAFQRGRDGLSSIVGSARDWLRTGVGLEYSRDTTLLFKSDTLDRVSGCLRGT